MSPEHAKELLAACKEIRDDLLMRGEKDVDGTIVVNASFSRWLRFTRAISASEGKAP